MDQRPGSSGKLNSFPFKRLYQLVDVVQEEGLAKTAFDTSV